MEWHVDARQRNCSESSLKFDKALGLLQLLRLLEARLDDVGKHFFHFLDRELFSEL